MTATKIRCFTCAKLTLLCLCSLITLPTASAQSIIFTFDNARLTDSGATYTLDVMVATDAAGVTAGAKLGDAQVYLNYNTAAFGTSVASTVTVNEGTLMQDVQGLDGHTIIRVTDNTASRIAITTDYLFDPATNFSTALSQTPQQYVEIVMPVVDAEASAGMSFQAALMTGQQSRANQDVFATVVATDVISEALPVELVAFEARLNGGTAQLIWATASETNNAGFSVERRLPNAPAWDEVGFVSGVGTTLEAQSYTYQVEAVSPGTHRFRLRQVDFDGTFAYSPEVELVVELVETYRTTSVYPNPTADGAQLEVVVRNDQAVSAAIYDVLGRAVRTVFDGRIRANTPHKLTLDTAGLPSGLYFVRVSGEQFNSAARFTVTR
ncbi:MAG: T9SS type A sorting domain-containing protein [Bacteroidota bacterium]